MTETVATVDPVEREALGRPRWPVPLSPADQPQAKPRAPSLRASVLDALHERRAFILLPFALLAGVIVSAQLPDEVPPQVLAAGWILLALGGVWARHGLAAARMMVLLGAAWTGLCLLPLHAALWGTEMLQRPAYGTYEARVDEILSEAQGETRAILSQITPTAGDRELPVRRARVVIRGGLDLSPGDVIEGPFRFAPVPGPVYPNGFDSQFHAYFDGIGAYGNSTQTPRITATGSEWALDHVVDTVRRGISGRIDAVLPQPSAGIARAIINGDQSAVTDEVREVMATAGIVHVLSVSGLHLTIVAGGVFWLVRLLLAGVGPIASRFPVKRLAAGAGVLAALLYFAISGGNVAAFRSTLMILLVFGAVLAGRRALTMRNVAIAALIVITTDPASVFRPSFQLSFAAVVALVGAYENFRSERTRDAGALTHIWRYVWGIAGTSLVAGAATVLFSVYHFQQTSPLGVVGNLVSLPLVGFVMMPAAAASVLAMPLGMEGPFLVTMGWSIDRMVEMAAIVSSWSEHLRASPLLTPLALLIGLAALAWFAFFRNGWRLLGPMLAVPAVVLFAQDRPPDVLIADTTQAVAIRGPSGLELADGKPQSFALDVWRETYADPIALPAATSCDSVACVGASNVGFTHALVRDPAGFAEECGRDLVIARIRAPSWCAATIVDADDLADRGVHWLRWDAGQRQFEVRPAITGLDRDWRIRP